MKKDKTLEIISIARLELLDLLEELGAAATHLREAYSEFRDGNERAASMSVEDAVEIIGRIERMCSEIGVSLCKWKEFEARAK
jgi:hypothetical protein